MWVSGAAKALRDWKAGVHKKMRAEIGERKARQSYASEGFQYAKAIEVTCQPRKKESGQEGSRHSYLCRRQRCQRGNT